MESLSPQVVSAAKLPILNPNEFDLWKMRIEQYFFMTDYSLWEVILNGDSPAPTRVVDGVLQLLKFNSHKDAKTLMEAIEKRFGGNTETKKVQKTLLKQQYENFLSSSTESLDQIHDRLQKLISQLEILGVSLSREDINLKFLRSLPSEWRTHTHIWRNMTDLEEQSLDDLFNSIKIDEAEVECYNCHRKEHFARKCRSPKDTRRNGAAEPQRRNVPVEASTSNALVSQCDSVESYDWSFQAEEEPTNYALMAFSYLSYFSNNEVISFFKACTKAYATLQSHYDKMTLNYRKSQFDVISYQTGLESVEARLLVYKQNEYVFEEDIKLLKIEVQLRDNALVSLRQNLEKPEQERDDLKLNDESLPPSPIYDRYQSGNGYHAVPPPYTGTFMPPKPDLVFNNALNDVETDHPAFHVKLSPTTPDQALSHTNRSSAPIIEDWVSDSEDESETQAPQILLLLSQKVQSLQAMANAGIEKHALPVSTVVPKLKVTRPRQHKPIVTKPNSPTSRHITRSPSPKASNSPPRVTSVKALVVNAAQGMHGKWEWKPKCLILDHVSHNTSASMTLKSNGLGPKEKLTILFFVQGNPQHALKDKGVIDSGCSRHITGNMSYLSNFEELNGGYVAFGGSPKGDESQVLLRVPRENNMYNVNLKNIVPSGDLTYLFAKAAINESNLWHRRMGHINFKTMNKLVKGLENQLSLKVKVIISDNEIEFKNNDLNQFCGMKGIKREFSVPTTPQQNDITERKNRTLIEAARTMLADSLLPIPFWTEAVNTACYVQNRVLVTKPHNKTPYELLHGRTPSIGFMRPFGCPVTIFNTLDSLGKFDGKVDEGFLVRYSVISKAFKVFNSRTHIIQETLHVNFLENKPNVAGSGPTWLFDIDTLTKTMNYQPVTAGNQSNPSASFQDKFNAEKAGEKIDQQYVLFPVWSSGSTNPQNTNEDVAFDEKEPEFAEKKSESEFNVSLSSSAQSKKHDDKTKKEAKGKIPACVGQLSPNNINTFSDAGPSNAAASPTHRKSSCLDTSQLPDDYDMSELENITYSDDEDDFGTDANFNNLETSITFSPIPATRVHKDHPMFNDDFHTCMFVCFLSQEEPKRVQQALKDPSWIEAMQEENKKDKRGIVIRNKDRLVAQGHTQDEGIDYKEIFAPVARIKVIRLFLAYASFIGFMVYQIDVKSVFLYGTIEEEVYVCQPPGFKDPNYSNKDLCKAFEKLMKDKFQMSSIWELTFFFGLQVKQKKDGIFIIQDKYVAKILRKFRLTDRKSASTPIDTEKPLLKDPDGKDVDVHTYRLMIGSLMYLTSSRPDIMFAVCACARFQVTPKASHLHAVKRIFCYLKGKPHLGLWYPKDSPFDLVAYSDSDYAGASLDRKSTPRGCQFFRCRLIFWQCKKQTVVATLSTEAEYVAAASCCAQVLWIQNQMLDYGRSKQPFILEESPIDTMADQRTMAELLRAPTEGTTNLRNEISNFQQRFDESFHEAWDRYKDLLHACPHHGFTELHQLDTFYNALNPTDQDSLNAAAGGNMLERQIAKLTDEVNQQTSDVTTAMTAILKQFQATPPPASVKSVEEICVTYSGAYPYYQCLAAGGNTFPELRDNIQGYVLAAVFNYKQGDSVYHPPEQSYQAPIQQNQNVPLSELEKVKRMNEANMKGMQTQINIVKNELRNETKNSIQASLSNQTNEIKNIMASLFQMNSASTSGSGSLPSNTVVNPKGELKAITTRSGIVLDGPTVPTPPLFINPEEDERVEETLTDPDLSEDPLHSNIPYPSRMLKQKQQEKDEVQIHKFWQMFKQLHINITLADALILMPKYQKMLKALLYNKEKLQELANTPLNEICSAVILKKLPEKLGDTGKFLIPCGFSELKCKSLADLGASINLMPLFIWKKLGLPELISTRMTLELANRAICTPVGIARDVFALVGKFTFPADFVIVDYESDPRVPFILGRPFLRIARALIDVHDNEMIPRDDFFEDLFSNQPSGNPTFPSHPELTSPEVQNIFDSEGGNVLPEKLLDLDSTKDLHPPLYFDVESDLKEIEFLLHQEIDSSLKDSIDQSNLANPTDNFVDSMPEMFTDEHALDYSSPLIFDEYDDDFLEDESDTENVYDDHFDSKGEKIKESKLLIDELDLPCDFLPPSKYDLFISQDFFRVNAKPSTNNEDKVFNPGILIQEKPFEIIARVVQDKKLAISNASLVLEDFDPPFYEPLFFKDVPRSNMLLPFSSENKEKVFKPGIHTSKKVHSSFIPELSHQGYKFSKSTKFSKA
nr:ribonuclease H-like domain-containing protein [Tanacetum cinerariifolium]